MEHNSFESFISLHKSQLEASGVPEKFYQSLFKKISEEIFDAGECKLKYKLIEKIFLK